MTPDPCVYRVFSRGSWRKHGRLYGWWQNLPKSYRKQLRLNGETVALPDYRGLHAAMLYARAGARLDGDPYDVGGGFSRDQAKAAFNIGVNARTVSDAIGAIADKTDFARHQAMALFEATPDAPSPDRQSLRQRCRRRPDAAGCRDIDRDLRDCKHAGIAVLPVHDELVVAARYASRVTEFMMQNVESRIRPVTPCEVRIN